MTQREIQALHKGHPRDWKKIGEMIDAEEKRLIEKYELGEVPCRMNGMGLGWFPIFDVYLARMQLKPNQLVQAKQKFCQARIYLNDATDEQQRLATECERLMDDTCEECGAYVPTDGLKGGRHTCEACRE
ncbi:MAG: hypothetical protein ACYDHY_06635 [Acidiferrobacterales bacterium]